MITDYTTERWGTEQAHLYLDQLIDTVETLCRNPHLGINKENIVPGLKSFPFKSHTLFFKQTANILVVVRVLHSSMDAPLQFNR